MRDFVKEIRELSEKYNILAFICSYVWVVL